MQIVAHGIDMVELSRIEAILTRHGGRFLRRVFTAREQAEAASVKKNVEKFAGRFATKEAVMKMIGTGWGSGVNWTDIEVVNGPAGVPTVNLSGRAKQIASQAGISQITLSITHTAELAIASVVALRTIDPSG